MNEILCADDLVPASFGKFKREFFKMERGVLKQGTKSEPQENLK